MVRTGAMTIGGSSGQLARAWRLLLLIAVLSSASWWCGTWVPVSPAGSLSHFQRLRLGVMLRTYRIGARIIAWDVDYTGAVSASLKRGEDRETWTVTDDWRYGNPFSADGSW